MVQILAEKMLIRVGRLTD